LMPTVGDARLPHGPAHAAINFLDKALLRLCANFHDALLAALHELQAFHGVADLGFDHQDHGIVAESGVRPEKYEEIGKAGDGDTEVRAHSFFPRVVNFHAASSDQAAADERLCGTDARPES